MIEVRVCRGGTQYIPPECKDSDSKLNWGDEISEPLLCTVESARERGRVEVDTSYADRLSAQVILHSSEFTQPGSMVSVTDGVYTDTGLLKSMSLSFARTAESIVVNENLDIEMLS